MKNKQHNRSQNQESAVRFLTDVPSAEDQRPIDFATEIEVSRRAYFNYLNEGSPRGRDVQHWLDAEAELRAEQNPIKAHGFHN